ncbi:unnamed protein product [Ambrosiozyma monospora]|uniref:Unnamed protein product n=1 Tax=Ambrosiozyma monospora TaxID=43982 RepID=A0ACB5U6L4_AMBMO|nr:unnamed protein product [Ambrosiozyma monospora]
MYVRDGWYLNASVSAFLAGSLTPSEKSTSAIIIIDHQIPHSLFNMRPTTFTFVPLFLSFLTLCSSAPIAQPVEGTDAGAPAADNGVAKGAAVVTNTIYQTTTVDCETAGNPTSTGGVAIVTKVLYETTTVDCETASKPTTPVVAVHTTSTAALPPPPPPTTTKPAPPPTTTSPAPPPPPPTTTKPAPPPTTKPAPPSTTTPPPPPPSSPTTDTVTCTHSSCLPQGKTARR